MDKARADQTDIVVIDFETTGVVKGYPDEPWQIGMALLKQGEVSPAPSFTSLLHVGDRPFHPQCPGRHAEIRDELAQAPTLYALWPQLEPWWRHYPLAAHNAATERSLLRKHAPFHRFGPWIDTLKLVRIAYPDLPTHQLEAILKQLNLLDRVNGLCPQREPHDALFDAFACAALLEHLLHLEGWLGVTLQILAQAHPHRFHQQLARRAPRRPHRRP